MSEPVRVCVRAEASPGLLCRIVGLFAQLGLPAPGLVVTVAGSAMDVEARFASFGEGRVATLARKVEGFVGVDAVRVIPEGRLSRL
jgi:hypothetical protein